MKVDGNKIMEITRFGSSLQSSPRAKASNDDE